MLQTTAGLACDIRTQPDAKCRSACARAGKALAAQEQYSQLAPKLVFVWLACEARHQPSEKQFEASNMMFDFVANELNH